MNYTFESYPKEAVVSHYEDVRGEVISYYSENDDIIAIYEYGSVNAPGVSDLDLIFVLKDQVNSDVNDFDLSNLSTFAYDLVIDGTVIKMPIDVFKNIQFFDNLNFHKLSGEDIAVVKPSELDDKFIKLASIVDWVPERILKLTRMLRSERINITNALCVLHSFGYSLKYLDKVLGDTAASQNVIQETARLRREWHSIASPEQELIKCLGMAIDVGYQRLFDYEEYLRGDDDYLLAGFKCGHDIDLELYKGHFIRFRDHGDRCFRSSALEASCDNKFYVVISSFFYPHFAILASGDGKLAECMRGKITPFDSIDDSIVNESYRNNLSRKINLAELNAEFLKGNNFKNGLIRYGFHF